MWNGKVCGMLAVALCAAALVGGCKKNKAAAAGTDPAIAAATEEMGLKASVAKMEKLLAKSQKDQLDQASKASKMQAEVSHLGQELAKTKADRDAAVEKANRATVKLEELQDRHNALLAKVGLPVEKGGLKTAAHTPAAKGRDLAHSTKKPAKDKAVTASSRRRAATESTPSVRA